MGGQQGSRGYLYQGIVSIFNACTETSWDQISVEYTTPHDKVDIALISNNGDILKAIQVKSSVNLFTKDNVLMPLKILHKNFVSMKGSPGFSEPLLC